MPFSPAMIDEWLETLYLLHVNPGPMKNLLTIFDHISVHDADDNQKKVSSNVSALLHSESCPE